MNTPSRLQSPGQAGPNHSTRLLPDELAAVALVAAPTCAAVGDMSVSWWLDKVACGIAPQPAIRSTRCTRWRAVEVAAFWRDFGSQPDERAADAVKAQATKASAAARSKRRTAADATAQAKA